MLIREHDETIFFRVFFNVMLQLALVASMQVRQGRDPHAWRPNKSTTWAPHRRPFNFLARNPTSTCINIAGVNTILACS
jgi:hypothetical protein